ncbi:MAG: exodeoxyribonuclease V subunit gamma [Gammaproteobacteria bacterium]|nr:exodeoxyribonuclease V subunit gamma [Gammaproteobacteria bacterium]
MLHLHHSNKLTQLVEILLDQMGKQQLGVLEPEQILVQNPGIKRWLQQQISQRHALAANIEFPLPSRFIWDIFLDQFDVEQLSAYDDEVLRWTLMQLLHEHRDDPKLKLLGPYLQQDEDGLASFQLAQKLAALFNQYLVYRPLLIEQWQQGQPAQDAVEAWQSHLWRLLRARQPQAHRAELIQRLIAGLQAGQADKNGLPRRVFVFAISAMSPLYMDVLAELGQQIDVHIFILNPCQHYWGDLEDRKQLIRQGETRVSDNELLASLGKQGRDYIDQFYERDYPCADTMAFVEIAGDSLLNRIQRQILNLEQDQQQQDFSTDRSIQITSCYSELRELQVLHDQLLSLLDQDPSLQPHDIVVMSPDINTLSPYIEAVFGEQPEHKRIPFSISDQDELASFPLFQAIVDWIGLANSRFTASELLAWLELPGVQRAYELDQDALEIIRHWITSTHIHWGYNQQHKLKLGLGDNEQNTWIQGINQLLTAYLLHEDVDIFAGQVAADSLVSNAELHALGNLHKFIDDLFHWSERLGQPLSLPQWQLQINYMLDRFLQLDDDEEWLVKTIRNQFSSWQQQGLLGGFNETISASLVQHMLTRAITESTAQHHYLSGGINFCNLIPMRTLPFSVVCLIGMGDEHFPRVEVPMQMDLIAMHPQKGDRSRREDDRYMFLQSLISAQDVFYISYVGNNKKDDSELEPSVVVAELIDHIEQTTGHIIPIRQTSLQAFSSNNYHHGSYADLWLPNPGHQQQAFDQEIPAIAKESNISLDELIGFYRNPIRYFMLKRLNLSLYDKSVMIDDDEPFTLDPLNRYRISHAMLDDLWQDRFISKEKYLNRGSLAQQHIGMLQFNELESRIGEIHQQINAHPGYDGSIIFQNSIDIETQLLDGRIHSYASKGLLQFTLSRLNGRQVFSWWIQHCFLCALEKIEFSEFLHRDGNGKLKKIGFDLLPKAIARQQLEQLLAGYNQGSNRIWPLYPDSAFEYEKIRQQQGEDKAWSRLQSLWSGDSFARFAEAEDIYIQTSGNNAGLFSDEFFQLSSSYMQPLLQSMVETAW